MKVKKIVIADSVTLCLVIWILIIMMVVTWKVYKIVKFYDKRLLLMLAFLNLTLLCK